MNILLMDSSDGDDWDITGNNLVDVTNPTTFDVDAKEILGLI